jgi:hypothetical protein
MSISYFFTAEDWCETIVTAVLGSGKVKPGWGIDSSQAFLSCAVLNGHDAIVWLLVRRNGGEDGSKENDAARQQESSTN